MDATGAEEAVEKALKKRGKPDCHLVPARLYFAFLHPIAPLPTKLFKSS